jgi:nucleotide-binding universal stress UspA family protein
MGRIVVGVDGTVPSQRALAWAIEEAGLRSATLEVICAYSLPAGWVGMAEAMGATVASPITEADMADYAQGTLDAVLGGVDPGSVVVEALVRRGHPGKVLVEASDAADLLVVGGGRGEAGGLLLGSVALHCVHRAECPVVVVRGHGREG